MVKLTKNKNDNTKAIIKKEIDKILTDFKTRTPTTWAGGRTAKGFADKWIELYKSDYADEAIRPALDEIIKAGYYVWEITGYFGRNCSYGTAYRITEVRLKPTPGCFRVV
jgi:hypothetical protein